MPDDGHLATTIYIASPEGDTGKSTIALGILHRLTMPLAAKGMIALTLAYLAGGSLLGLLGLTALRRRRRRPAGTARSPPPRAPGRS